MELEDYKLKPTGEIGEGKSLKISTNLSHEIRESIVEFLQRILTSFHGILKICHGLTKKA